MVVVPGQISIFGFLAAISSISLLWTDSTVVVYVLPLYYFVLNVAIWAYFKGFEYQVAVRSCFLGGIFSCGIFVSILAPETYTIFGWYMCVLSFFHYSEFLAIALCNPDTLSIDSFILDHSLDYKIAATTSWIEFFLERWYFPDLKQARLLPIVGLNMCILGELMRKTAMLTASSNFTHAVVPQKSQTHKLITHGIYRFFRHPSYVGWFYWSIGTQIILVNPVCTVAYALASWKFFKDRITVEELTLLNFFGYDYANYQDQVPTGLPFIQGYRLTD